MSLVLRRERRIYAAHLAQTIEVLLGGVAPSQWKITIRKFFFLFMYVYARWSLEVDVDAGFDFSDCKSDKYSSLKRCSYYYSLDNVQLRQNRNSLCQAVGAPNQ